MNEKIVIYEENPDIGKIYICPNCHAFKVERVMTNTRLETFEWYCCNCGIVLEYEPHLTIEN